MLLDAGSRSGCSLLECVTDQAIESPSAKGERCSIFCAQFGIFAGGKTPGNYLDAVLIERATGRPSCLVHVRGDAKDDLRKHCKLCMTKRSSCWEDRDCFCFFLCSLLECRWPCPCVRRVCPLSRTRAAAPRPGSHGPLQRALCAAGRQRRAYEHQRGTS